MPPSIKPIFARLVTLALAFAFAFALALACACAFAFAFAFAFLCLPLTISERNCHSERNEEPAFLPFLPFFCRPPVIAFPIPQGS